MNISLSQILLLLFIALLLFGDFSYISKQMKEVINNKKNRKKGS